MTRSERAKGRDARGLPEEKGASEVSPCEMAALAQRYLGATSGGGGGSAVRAPMYGYAVGLLKARFHTAFFF